MLNMEKVGRKISELRKKCNMTQMELADKMGISYQAVSNWECGKSMPDITKIPELAELFGITMDELLGEKSELMESAVKGDVEGMVENLGTLGELVKIAPLMKPVQVNEVVKKAELDSLGELDEIIPFVDEDILNELARKRIKEGKNITELLPFISDEIISDFAERLYEKGGVHALDDVVPFMSEKQLQRMAEEEYANRGLRNLDVIAPFLNEKWLNKVAKEALEKDGIKAISHIAPFLDRKMLSEYVKEKYL